MKRNVINRDYLPARAPLSLTIATTTALDHFNAPGWLFGSIGLLLGIFWGMYFYLLFTEKQKGVELK